jgi:hypothetical protein
MLKDGIFYREEPPNIGEFYIPKPREDQCTPEEQFVQDIILGQQEKPKLLSKVLGYVLKM